MSKETATRAQLEKLEEETRARMGDQDEYIQEMREQIDDRMTRIEKRVLSVEGKQERIRETMKKLRAFVREMVGKSPPE